MLQTGGISKTKTVLQSPETIAERLRQQTFNIEMAPVHSGPGAHPASYTMGTRSFPGVKRLGHGIDHPPPSNAKVEGRVQLHLLPLWAFLACSRVNITFTFFTFMGR
jgi:hypothetical protein